MCLNCETLFLGTGGLLETLGLKGLPVPGGEDEGGSLNGQPEVDGSLFVDEGDASVDLFLLGMGHGGEVAVLGEEEGIGGRDELGLLEVGEVD